MSNIYAGQHIYGNVEKSESPSNIGGFQTLFYSKDLISESESDEIERRLGYFPSEDNPEKILFFKMGEKFVTTQIIPLEDVDKFGRKGAYIAHSFVFLNKEFEKFKYNPFVIFDLFQDNFVKTLLDALARGKREDQNIAPVEFPLNKEKIRSQEIEIINSINLWNQEEIKKLVFLAINEQKLKAESKSFIISGNQHEIRNTIKAIFSLIPDKVRSSCSFDTYFLGCNPVATKYWTYCYPKAPNLSPQLILANTDTRTVSNVNIDISTPFEKWIFSSNYPDDIKEKCIFRNTALEIDRFLTNKDFDKEKILKSINSPNLEMFLEINQSLLQVKLQSYFKGLLSDNFAKYVLKAVTSVYNSQPKAVLFQKLINGFDNDEIINYLFNEIKGIKSPSKQEINELKEFITKNKDKLLQILFIKWTGTFDDVSKNLKTLTDNEYIIAMDLLIENVEIKYLIVDSKISLFTEIFVSEAAEKKDLREKTLELVKIYFDLNQIPLLSKIIPIIPKLNRTLLVSIQDYIAVQKEDKKKNIPEDFNKILNENIELSKQTGGTLNIGNLKDTLFKRK
jgi:hypothetical protein